MDTHASLLELAPGAAGQARITAIRAVAQRRGGRLVRVETDAGVYGIGPCHGNGRSCAPVISSLEGPRLPHLSLIGKDPLALGVHFHNLMYAYPSVVEVIGVLSAIDIALWDLAGKLLGRPVHSLLGGPSATGSGSTLIAGGDFLSKAEWRDRARALREDPRGFTAYKIDIHRAGCADAAVQPWHWASRGSKRCPRVQARP